MFKYTFIYQMTTNPVGAQSRRTGGWSESIYFDTGTLVDGVNSWAAARAALLPPQAAIVGLRVQQVVPTAGKGRTRALNFTGTAPETDQPQAALLYTAAAITEGNASRRTLRCFPDSWITGGELNPAASGFGAAWAAFRAQMLLNWKMRGENLSFTVFDIVGANNVTIAGEDFVWFTTQQAHGFLVGQDVQISRVVGSDNLPLGTKVLRVTDVSDYTFQVRLATPLPVNATGLVRRKQIIYPTITDVTYSRVVTRKVGRAPFQFVGRV